MYLQRQSIPKPLRLSLVFGPTKRVREKEIPRLVHQVSDPATFLNGQTHLTVAFHLSDAPQFDERAHELAYLFPEIAGSNTCISHQPEQADASRAPQSGVRRTRRRFSRSDVAVGSTLEEAQKSDAQAMIDAQHREIRDLTCQAKKLQQQSEFFRKKAMTYRALYSQQQMVSEQLMASIVQLRDRQT
jgi:hypothetical protein